MIDEEKERLNRLYGKFGKRPSTILCRLGFHSSVWYADINHNKVTRKVYGMDTYCICKRCGRYLGGTISG